MQVKAAPFESLPDTNSGDQASCCVLIVSCARCEAFRGLVLLPGSTHRQGDVSTRAALQAWLWPKFTEIIQSDQVSHVEQSFSGVSPVLLAAIDQASLSAKRSAGMYKC